jgi:hypothetical protein
VELDHDADPVADGLPDLGERLERGVQLGGRYVEAGRAFGGDVERPDFHAGDPLLQQGMRHLVGTVKEALEILVRPALLAHMPVCDALGARVANVLVAGAGVVDADGVARAPAQHVADRLAVRLAEDIPQRDIDRGVAARFDARRTPAEIVARECRVDRLDLQRIAANNLGSDRLVQVGLDRLRPHERLAKSDNAFVGMHPHEEQVAEFLDPDGLKCRDLHEVCPAGKITRLMRPSPNPALRKS